MRMQIMDGSRWVDLARLHGLAQRCGSGDAVRVAWREYIKATATRIVKDEEKARGRLK
jgi:hypothetical protein